MFSGPIGDRKRTKQTYNLKNYAEKPSFYWPVLSQIVQNMTLWRVEGTQKVWHHAPLRVRLDGTTLKLASNPHQESLYLPLYIGQNSP